MGTSLHPTKSARWLPVWLPILLVTTSSAEPNKPSLEQRSWDAFWTYEIMDLVSPDNPMGSHAIVRDALDQIAGAKPGAPFSLQDFPEIEKYFKAAEALTSTLIEDVELGAEFSQSSKRVSEAIVTSGTIRADLSTTTGPVSLTNIQIASQLQVKWQQNQSRLMHELGDMATRWSKMHVKVPAGARRQLEHAERTARADLRKKLRESGYQEPIDPESLAGKWKASFGNSSHVEIDLRGDGSIEVILFAKGSDRKAFPGGGWVDWAGDGKWALDYGRRLRAATATVSSKLVALTPAKAKNEMMWADTEIESSTSTEISFVGGGAWKKLPD